MVLVSRTAHRDHLELQLSSARGYATILSRDVRPGGVGEVSAAVLDGRASETWPRTPRSPRFADLHEDGRLSPLGMAGGAWFGIATTFGLVVRGLSERRTAIERTTTDCD